MKDADDSASAAPKSSASDLARTLVSAGIAPDAAVGWAARTSKGGEKGWELGAGWFSGARSHLHGATTSIDSEPIFDLASLTKPMTAFAIAIARLREVPIETLVDEARNTPSAGAPIELLLAHRAGLEAHLPLYESLVTGELVPSAALRVAASARRRDAVGALPMEGFDPTYSDLGYMLVGEALARSERARDAGEVIETRIARALGCANELGTARSLRARKVDFDARVRPTEVVAWRGGEVRGAVHDENAWALTADGGSGHAGMFGTVHAVLAFGCAALDAISHQEGVLAAGDLSWLVRERPGGSLRAGFDGKSPSGSSAGEIAGPRTFGHLGFTGTSLWIDPDAEAVVVVLTNRVHPTRENVAIRAARPKMHDALFTLAQTRGASISRVKL